MDLVPAFGGWKGAKEPGVSQKLSLRSKHRQDLNHSPPNTQKAIWGGREGGRLGISSRVGDGFLAKEPRAVRSLDVIFCQSLRKKRGEPKNEKPLV